MPEPTIHEAVRDLSNAEVEVANLEQAIIDGDKAVTPAVLEKAKAAVRFLTLQCEGAEKRQAVAEERDREAAVAEAYTERDEFYATGTAAAKEAYAALVAAARTFISEWDKAREAYSEAGSRARDLGLELRQDTVWLFDFQSYLGEGDFLRAAMREANGERLHRAHGLHDDETRAAYAEREAAQQRWEEERQKQFEASFTTGPEHAA